MPASVLAARAPVSGHLQKSKHSFRGSVRNLPPGPTHAPGPRNEREGPEPAPPGPTQSAPVGSGASPGALAPAPSPSSNFDGLGFADDCGGVSCGDGHPPDTNGDVGPRYYIQTVNTAVGIYNKSNGTRAAGFSFNALMSQGSFGNLCDTDNFGDPVVVYDSFHDRWIITDFAFQLDSHNNVVSPPGSFQCFAVSRTGDPVNGGWNFYSINITDFLQDYPKFGVWPDGLYMSANMFGFRANGSFQDARVWSFNLAQMEAGAASPQFVSFDASPSYFTLLPSNARLQAGTPPTGTPNLFASVGNFTNSVQVWKFHVDWANTANSTFTGPTNSTTATAIASPPSTVPSGSGGNNLDTLALRTMMQNQYSNIGGVESLWDSHTVRGSTTSQSAVRWYQVPVTGGTIGSALQASTWNPDTSDRYMPSVAVDRLGDMAIGYTASSATLFPAIRYAARLSSDPVNTLSQTETSLIDGTGTQSGNCGGSACTRWGDYSAMTLDPNGCTFWYTNEYYAVTGLNDRTRIGSFQLPGCTPLAAGNLHGTVTDQQTSNPISGATVTAGIQSTTTDSSGAYSFGSVPAGTYTVNASAANHASGSQSGVVVSNGGNTTQDFALGPAQVADHLTITSSTAGLSSGTTRTITAEVRDAGNQLVAGDNSTVVAFSQSGGTGSVTGLGTATAVGGVASITVTGGVAGPVTIAAAKQGGGITGDSTSFNVTPGAASKLVFTSSTASVASGQQKTLTAEVRDAANNLVSSDNSTVVVFSQTGGAGSVSGLQAATASGGVASVTVTGVTAGPVTVTAAKQGGGLTTGSTTFSVTPGTATKLVITSSTANLASTTQRSITAEVRDANDNLETGDNSTVVAFSKTAGAGSVSGLTTATASGGVASVNATGVTAGSVTITAAKQGGGLTSGTTTFTIVPGPAAKLVFTSSTTSVASGQQKTLTAEVRDANDNLETGDNTTVVGFAQTSGGGSVTGLASATAVSGVASRTVTGATAGSVTVSATKSGLTSDSTTFSVTAGAASKLVFTSSTASVASGQQKTLTVEVRDAADNLETGDSSTVVVFSKTAGAGSVSGLGTATASGGVASLNVTGLAAGPVTIAAAKQGGGLTGDTTSFSVTAGAASKLVFTSSTGSVASGQQKTLTVEVRDSNDNLETGDNSTVVQFSQSGGAGSVTGLGTATAAGGIASKTVTGDLAGSVTVAAAKQGGGLTGDSTTFDVTPTPSHLTFTSSTTSVASGQQKTLTVEVRDTNNQLVSSDNSTVVTFSQTSGAGSVSGLTTATASGGVATLNVTGLGAGSVTIAAAKQGGGLTGDSTSFNVTPGAAAKLVFTSSTTSVASGEQKTLTAEVRDANDNLETSDNTTAVSFSKTSGNGSVTGLATATAVGGVASKTVNGGAVGDVQIQATSAGLTASSTSFAVIPGAPDHLVFTSSGADLASGGGRDLTVEVRDVNDNRVDSSAAPVALAQVGGTGSVDGVPVAVHALAGVAAFPITGATSGAVQLQATSAGLASSTTSFTIVPGSPSRLVFTSSTANLASGAARELTVEVRDGSGNLVAATPMVSFAQTAGKGSVTGLPATAVAVSGTATHAVTGFRGGDVTITATAPPLAAASTSFTIAPGPRGRKITLALARRVLSGRVGGGPACGARAIVKIEMRLPKSRRWKRFRMLHAKRNASFSTRVSKIAAYRARVALEPGCAAATSRVRRLTR